MIFAHVFENDWLGILPEGFLAVTILGLLVAGVILSTSAPMGFPLMVVPMIYLSVWALLVTVLLVLHTPFEMVAFYNVFVVDALAGLLKLGILGGATAALLMSTTYVRTHMVNIFEYGILILLASLAMLFLVSSYDFLSMYLAIEMQALCFYVLAGCKRNSEFSTEAGLKYFLLGAFSSGLLLFGMSLVYGCTGLTNVEDVAKLLVGIEAETEVHALTAVGLVMVTIGFLFKLSAAPFHFWAPDVYEGAPSSVTAFFAIVPKFALVGCTLRVLLTCFYDFLFVWQHLVVVSVLASLLIGAFGAMAQKKIKRVLVYSSIGHVGFILMGLLSGTVEGVQAVLVYLVIYALTTVNIFGIVLSVSSAHGEGDMKYISDLKHLSKAHPALAFALAMTLFSLAGIPPLAGFYAKFIVLFGALTSDLYTVALFGVLTSVVSAFYYLRLIKVMYFEAASDEVTVDGLDRAKATLVACTSVFLMGFFLYPQILFLWTEKVASAFLG